MNQRSTVFDKTKWLILALTLLARVLRVYRLEAQSLWSDEGLSLYRARLTLTQNLSGVIVVPPGVSTQDTNPPFYFVLLSSLRAVAGESEYALRFLSVLAGVALVPLLYATGRRLFSVRTGVLAAWLGALSPFLVWYSQEARMYTLVAALNLASVYLLLRLLEFPRRDAASVAYSRRRGLIWIAWGGITLAMLATHFTAFFLLPFEGGVLLVALGRSRRREALLVTGLLLVLALPLIAYGWSRAQNMLDPVFRFRPLDSIAQEVWSSFLVGNTSEIFQPWWAVAPGLIILSVAILGGLITRSWRAATLLVVLYLGLPLLVFYAGTSILPLYIGPRHVIFTLPSVYLLLAAGLALTWQRLRAAGLLALMAVGGLMIWWLGVQFTAPAYLKDDIRSAACAIAARAKTDDVVIMTDAISSYMFDYYYTRCHGVAPWKIIPPYPSRDDELALRQFQAEAQIANRVWFLTQPSRAGGFDSQALDEWARGHYLRLDHRTFPSMWLGAAYQLYTAHFPIFDAVPVSASPVDRLWAADGLHLAGADPIDVSNSRDKAVTTLYWKVDNPPQNNLVITQRLVDDAGAEWGLLVGTAFDNWSAKNWPVGKIIRQDAAIVLPHGLPAGRYRLRVSVAEKQSDVQLTLPDGSTETEVTAVIVQP